MPKKTFYSLDPSLLRNSWVWRKLNVRFPFCGYSFSCQTSAFYPRHIHLCKTLKKKKIESEQQAKSAFSLSLFAQNWECFIYVIQENAAAFWPTQLKRGNNSSENEKSWRKCIESFRVCRWRSISTWQHPTRFFFISGGNRPSGPAPV